MIVPKTLVFSEQGFGSGGYYVELCGEKLLFSTDYPPLSQRAYQESVLRISVLKSILNDGQDDEQDDESDDRAYTIPSEAEWKAFRETLDKINFWRWKREYVDTGILDGVQVEITIEYEKKKKIYCSNAFPDEYDDFKKALSRLTDGLVDSDDVITDIDEVHDILEENKWIFAKTMPETPHFYTLRRTWSDEKKFESIVEYIREQGIKEKFEGKEYIYLYLGDFKYWTMGEAVKDTILINRAKI